MSAELMKTVEQLNGKVNSLNMERSRQLGLQESARDQYSKAIQAYEMKYGVKLTEANLQEEYNKVYAETKGNVVALQTAVEAIERGDYKNVERPKDIDLEPNVVIPTPQVAAPVQQAPTPAPTPVQAPQVATPVQAQAPTQAPPINFGGFGDLGMAAAQQQAQTPPPAAPVNFTAPAADEQDTAEETEEEESFTPAGWGTPKSSDEINKNFTDILNSSGIKFGE